MGGPPGNSSRGTAGLVSVPERYVVAGADARGRPASGSERRTVISVVAAGDL
jgi:hypothetical protein